jgi:hypothetical protein
MPDQPGTRGPKLKLRKDSGFVRTGSGSVGAGGWNVAGKPFRPVSRPHAASAVLAELARLWDQATHRAEAAGVKLTQRQLADESRVLARWAGEQPSPAREWSRLLRADRTATGPAPPGLGRLISDLDDSFAFALEVHRPVQANRPNGKDFAVLPFYIERPHDKELADVVKIAARGRSVLAVLVGGSSTAKTRACWQAIRHREVAGWRLWHPFDPSRPEALLAELPQVGPRTVIWLNETQHYLDATDETGERTAAALRTLLSDRDRRPVLILGTVWPEHWHALIRPGDEHSQARALLEGTAITVAVPPAFDDQAMADLRRAADSDLRLAATAGAAARA